MLWNELQQCWSWYIYCFFKLRFKMSLYAPIDWVGGPDKKIFCSRSWQMDFTVLGLCFITKIRIFSCLTQPNWVNKHFFIWPLDVENFRYMQQKNPPKILQLKLFFWKLEQETPYFLKHAPFFSFLFSIKFLQQSNASAARLDGFFRTSSRQHFPPFTC